MALVHVSVREGDGQVVVVLRGVLDVMDAVSVATALAAVAAPDREVIVDLAGLAFMDSSGVAALVHGRKQARAAGGELLLAAPQPQVLRVLVLTRLIDVFRVCASVDEAARSVSHSPQVAAPVAQRWLGSFSWPSAARRQGRLARERVTRQGRPSGYDNLPTWDYRLARRRRAAAGNVAAIRENDRFFGPDAPASQDDLRSGQTRRWWT